MANAKGIFKAVAPWLFAGASTLLPGPLGQAAAKIGEIVGKPDLKPDLDEITNAVAGATPEQLASIRAADQEYSLNMQKAGFQHIEDLTNAAYADTANARAREIAVRDKTPERLAYLIVGSTMGMCWYVLTGHAPNATVAQAGTIGTVLGYAISEAKQAIAYFLGSSLGSKAKDETIDNLSK